MDLKPYYTLCRMVPVSPRNTFLDSLPQCDQIGHDSDPRISQEWFSLTLVWPLLTHSCLKWQCGSQPVTSTLSSFKVCRPDFSLENWHSWIRANPLSLIILRLRDRCGQLKTGQERKEWHLSKIKCLSVPMQPHLPSRGQIQPLRY